MKGIKYTLGYVISLFVIETILQVVLFGISLKYFEPYNEYEKIGKILSDAFTIIGTVKLLFFLPCYFLFYLIIIGKENHLSVIKKSTYHAILFLSIYLIVSLMLPGNVAGKIIDTLILTIVAFATSYLLSSSRVLSGM